MYRIRLLVIDDKDNIIILNIKSIKESDVDLESDDGINEKLHKLALELSDTLCNELTEYHLALIAFKLKDVYNR
jgi:hypothetical protein